MSWTSEDLKYKMCKLQEFGILSGLHFFPLIYGICVICSVHHLICDICFYNEICEWLPFLFSFLMWAFYDRNSKSSLECYALDICLRKTWVKIQDAYLNNTVSPTVLESDARGDGAPYGSLIIHRVVHLCMYVGSSLKKNNKQVQDVMSDLVNQCTRNTLPRVLVRKIVIKVLSFFSFGETDGISA